MDRDSRMQRTPPGPEPDILFSKPANAEQYEIAARLVRSKAVLVQGPPGTGKTHTWLRTCSAFCWRRGRLSW